VRPACHSRTSALAALALVVLATAMATAGNREVITKCWHRSPHNQAHAIATQQSNSTATPRSLVLSGCDAHSDASDWHKDFGCAIGKRVPNATVSTYLRNSKGTSKDGSAPGSRYFVASGPGTQEWCTHRARGMGLACFRGCPSVRSVSEMRWLSYEKRQQFRRLVCV
jgi:hypothetical protein